MQRVGMVGRKRLPCDHQAVRLDMEPGDYHRQCSTCGKEYVASVQWSVRWTRKMGRPTLVVHWLDAAS